MIASVLGANEACACAASGMFAGYRSPSVLTCMHPLNVNYWLRVIASVLMSSFVVVM